MRSCDGAMIFMMGKAIDLRRAWNGIFPTKGKFPGCEGGFMGQSEPFGGVRSLICSAASTRWSAIMNNGDNRPDEEFPPVRRGMGSPRWRRGGSQGGKKNTYDCYCTGCGRVLPGVPIEVELVVLHVHVREDLDS